MLLKCPLGNGHQFSLLCLFYQHYRFHILSSSLDIINLLNFCWWGKMAPGSCFNFHLFNYNFQSLKNLWMYIFRNPFRSLFKLMWTIKNSTYCIYLEHFKSSPTSKSVVFHLGCTFETPGVLFEKYLCLGPIPDQLSQNPWGQSPALTSLTNS